MEWLLFALGAAIFSALARVLIKVSKNSDSETIVFSRYFYSLIPAAIFLLVVGIGEVQTEFYYWIALAAIVDIGAIAFMTLSVKESKFYKSLPMLSFTPIFVLLTGFIFLGEIPSFLGLIGIFIIVMGAYFLTHKEHEGLFEPFRHLYREKGPRYMLGTAFLFSFLGVFWKKSLLASNLPLTISVGLLIPTIIALGFFGIKGKMKEVFPDKKDWWKLMLFGFATFAIMFFVLSSFETGFVSYVISIKRFSIIIGVVIGALFFKEKNPAKHIIGSLIMVGGAVLISLS